MAYARTTITDLRNLLTERLGGNETFWVPDEIDYALNETIAVWQLITGDFVLTYNQPVVTGSAIQTIDNTTTPSLGFVRMRGWGPDGLGEGGSTTTTALYPISIQELDQGYYGRQGAASGITEYWAPFGIDQFVVYPTPASAGYIVVQYYSADPRLSLTGSAYLDLGDEEVLRLIDYAQWVLSFKEGLKEAFVNTTPIKELFLAAAKLRSAKLRGTSLYKNYMGNDRDELKPRRNAEEQTGLRG